MSIESRAQQVIADLFAALGADDQGRSRVDVGLVMEVVRRDPDAVAFALQKVLSSPLAKQVGWSIWLVTAQLFERERGDDSLMVLVRSAAAAAGDRLPNVVSFTPSPPVQSSNKIVVLQMTEADVAAGDAHRMLMLMSLENLPAEQRQRMFGRCIITFPAEGDSRPVQHIERIRAYVADLHRRMPYFPLFLHFDEQHGMRAVYFGCLADAEATEVLPDGVVGTNMGHPSFLSAIKSALVAIRQACMPLQIDWKPCAEAIVAPYDAALRGQLLS